MCGLMQGMSVVCCGGECHELMKQDELSAGLSSFIVHIHVCWSLKLELEEYSNELNPFLSLLSWFTVAVYVLLNMKSTGLSKNLSSILFR
jgi:hypothetical protein